MLRLRKVVQMDEPFLADGIHGNLHLGGFKFPATEGDPIWHRVKRALLEAQALLHQRGIPLVVVIFPAASQVTLAKKRNALRKSCPGS